jgi:signal transduction histidine kinase
LLIVVIRACLLFSWRGRIAIAVAAYVSFLSLEIMIWLRISPFGIPLGKPLPPPLRRLPPEELRGVIFGLTFNSVLLFGLVLTFVLLLVGAMLAEHQSRAKLTLANRRLRQYALQIGDRATLEERNRIAREIHDSVGHYLTAQSIQLENAALFLERDLQKAANHLHQARQLGKEALQNIRHSIATLRDRPLAATSLTEALDKLVTEFQMNTGIAISTELNLMADLAPEAKIAVYRIAQEALTNIAKHSQATQANLYLAEIANRIYLKVKDNGCGFNLVENTTGFGLQGMQERTAALGGKLEIFSQLGKGCEIRVEIPILGIVE